MWICCCVSYNLIENSVKMCRCRCCWGFLCYRCCPYNYVQHTFYSIMCVRSLGFSNSFWLIGHMILISIPVNDSLLALQLITIISCPFEIKQVVTLTCEVLTLFSILWYFIYSRKNAPNISHAIVIEWTQTFSKESQCKTITCTIVKKEQILEFR